MVKYLLSIPFIIIFILLYSFFSPTPYHIAIIIALLTFISGFIDSLKKKTNTIEFIRFILLLGIFISAFFSIRFDFEKDKFEKLNKEVTDHKNANSAKIDQAVSSDDLSQVCFGGNLQAFADLYTSDLFNFKNFKIFNFRKNKGKYIFDANFYDKNDIFIMNLNNLNWTMHKDVRYDRNYDPTHFEIFDNEEKIPILQIAIVDNVLIINGIFYSNNGDTIVATMDGRYLDKSRLKFQEWFKYPSDQYPGEINEQGYGYSLKNFCINASKNFKQEERTQK